MPVLSSSIITVLPIFPLTFYILSYSFILTHNNIVFDDHNYQQTSGTVEQTFIDNTSLTPLFYVRFIDDIFMIWTHGSEELEQFTTRANSTHPSIKFTIEIPSSSLPFKDVPVCVTETGIKTSLNRRPTDRPTYLMYCSFHPHHIIYCLWSTY